MVKQQTTKWSPTTCDCVFEYTWDRYFCSDCGQFNAGLNWCNFHNRPTYATENCEDNDTEPVRTHNHKTTITKCAAHAGMSDSNHFRYIHDDENPRHMWTIDELKVVLLLPDTPLEELIGQYQITWWFEGSDDTRVLHITSPLLNPGQKNRWQKQVDSRLGVGKVIIG